MNFSFRARVGSDEGGLTGIVTAKVGVDVRGHTVSRILCNARNMGDEGHCVSSLTIGTTTTP